MSIEYLKHIKYLCGMQQFKKKQIKIDNDIITDLKILAVKAGKDLQNFIQDHLRQLVEQARKAGKV